jgi:L-asparaginase II
MINEPLSVNDLSESLVEVRRGDVLESVHKGHFVVVTPSGEIVDGAGDPEFMTYPRSSLKLIQAIGLIESGAADHYKLGHQHISIACASHKGEPFHINTVDEWLRRIGCAPEDLACGPDLPRNPEAMVNILAAGNGKRSVYHNCSGKHTSFLTVCRHLDIDPIGYDAIDHPSQSRYLDDLSLLCGCDARTFSWGVDACTLPAPAMALNTMATAIAKLAVPKVLGAAKKIAVERIFEAITHEPEYFSGTNQVATVLSRVTNGRIIAKPGAEGYFVAAVRDRGLGVALKITDGAGRASAVAIIAILAKIGALSSAEVDKLKELAAPAINDSRGRLVGGLFPSKALIT